MPNERITSTCLAQILAGSATVRSLSNCHQLVGGIVAAHHGRVVDTPGDNLLAEFGSAVDAVEAACAM